MHSLHMEPENEILRIAADILARRGRLPLAELVREAMRPVAERVQGANPGERLRSLRKAAGFTSAKAAAEANGWSPQTYIQHESGIRPIPLDRAEKYAQTYRVPASLLLFGVE